MCTKGRWISGETGIFGWKRSSTAPILLHRVTTTNVRFFACFLSSPLFEAEQSGRNTGYAFLFSRVCTGELNSLLSVERMARNSVCLPLVDVPWCKNATLLPLLLYPLPFRSRARFLRVCAVGVCFQKIIMILHTQPHYTQHRNRYRVRSVRACVLVCFLWLRLRLCALLHPFLGALVLTHRVFSLAPILCFNHHGFQPRHSHTHTDTHVWRHAFKGVASIEHNSVVAGNYALIAELARDNGPSRLAAPRFAFLLCCLSPMCVCVCVWCT